MTWATVLLVTAVVWGVTLIRSVRLRAFVYSLPLPMTLAFAGTGLPVDGTQLLGVVALNLFFLTVTLLHHRLRVPIVLADLGGLAVYLGLSAALLRLVPLPFLPTLAGVLGLWVLVMAMLRRRRPDPATTAAEVPIHGTPVRIALPAPVRLLVVLAGSTVTVLLGEQLRGLVVTFPYSGVLVAIETRRDLPEFSRHFARNSLALVGFLAGCHWLRDQPQAIMLVGGWIGYGVTALLLRLPSRWPRALSRAPTRRPTRARRPG